MRAWLNGRFAPIETLAIDPSDRGFLLGDGVFETIPIHHGRPFDLDAHLSRLDAGMGTLGFGDAVDLAALHRDVWHYVAAEALDAAVLRLTVTRGSGPRGLSPPADPKPTILMTWAPPPLPRDGALRAIIATATRRNDASPVSRIKALPYLDNLIALREAKAKGADEALLLNTRGVLAGATIANVFVVLGDWLMTPPIDDGALPGTMRARVIALAQTAGLPTHEGPIAPSIFADADAVFLTNSVRGIMPVDRVDDQAIGTRSAGIVTKMQELVDKAIEAECKADELVSRAASPYRDPAE